MNRRFNRLILTTLIAILLFLVFGCTQPDDVTAPASTTRIILQPERLPTLPDSFYYHIWLIDTAQMAYSVGSFYWSDAQYEFYDLDSNVIDSMWTINYDILDPFYRYIGVSVENIGDPPSGSVLPQSLIGPIMVQDTIYSNEERLMKMVFPLDLWLGYGFFAVETPSDSDSQSNDVSGLWFAEYLYDSLNFRDTTNVTMDAATYINRPLLITPHEVDSVYYHCNQFDRRLRWICRDSVIIDASEYDSLTWQFISVFPEYSETTFVDHIALDTVDADTMVIMYSTDVTDTLPITVMDTTYDTVGVNFVKAITDSNYTLQDSLVLDTFVHTYVDFDYISRLVNTDTADRYDTVTIYSNYDELTDTWLTEKDTVYRIKPYVDYDHDLNYTQMGRIVNNGQDTVYYIKVDKFVNSFEESPDLSDAAGDFTPEYDKKWHYKGWLLSPYLSPTSSFAKLSQPNWSPFYIKSQMAPLDAPMISTGTFKRFDRPDDGNPYTDNHRVPSFPGEDFLLNLPTGVTSIKLASPGNHEGKILITLEPDNFTSDSTNFPLILYVGNVPPYDAMTDTTEHSQRVVGVFDVTNWSSGVAGYGAGFPIIHVTYVRE